ncbi:hypothetical protein CMV_006590 [Castanea mollissima]|uniref:DUF4283 domain-containing protein n=1 Tax=Castanea mollissima TaxID=60419 RepID=A0A8J4RGS7_9ROSI|nr:hypothetical protein CMV_006590 [Castanea mollissima]
MVVQCALSSSVSEAVKKALIQSSSLTWESAILSNMLIFVLGLPILLSGLSLSGIASAFLLGTLTWRAFGPPAFLLVATYFIIGTAVTKVKMAQKEAQGVAEKRKGRRGPGSVIGSSAAGCICAFLSIFQVGGPAFSQLWKLGFVASFCTKLSDTVSSEIGKAYGKTTYLVTTFKIVPRGTEGAVSVEGTIAGLLASILLSFVGCVMGEISAPEAIICIIASQVANVGESIIGAALQEKEGFQWLNNDVVNIINISMGSIIAVLMQQLLLQNWLMSRNDFKIREADDHILLFVFDFENDAERILAMEPWVFDKHLVLFQRYDFTIPTRNLRFTTTKFWVQMHGLPLTMLDLETTIEIGETIGSVSQAEHDKEMVGGTFLRVKVEVDVSKPLCRENVMSSLVAKEVSVWTNRAMETGLEHSLSIEGKLLSPLSQEWAMALVTHTLTPRNQ